MLLSEMVRKIREESRLIDDPTERDTLSTSYVTVASYNITLGKASFLTYSYELFSTYSSTIAYARLKIGTLYVGGEAVTGTTPVLKSGFFTLNAGSYTIELQLKSNSPSYRAKVKNFVVGTVSFPDMALIPLRDYGSQNVNVSVGRKTCIGVITRSTIAIQVYNTAAPTVTVDGSAVPAAHTDNEKYVYAVSVGAGGHTINASAGNYSVAISPWLLPASDSEFVSLVFPQGSTLYIVLEPLFLNLTKNIKLGKKKAVSFGDAADYYSTASGTNILSWNYTFESVNVENVTPLVSGVGGCISIIAIDIRG